MKKESGVIFTLIFGVALLSFIMFSSSKNKKVVFEKEKVETGKKEDLIVTPEELLEATEKADQAEKVDFEKKEGSLESQKTIESENKSKKEVNLKKETEAKNTLVSWGFSKSSGRLIDTIIIHSSYNALGGDEYDLEKLLAEYKEYAVAPHYLIDRKGKVYRLVEDKNVAYHAGESKVPDGRKNVNSFSIGIELMNTKTDKCTAEQYTSLSELVAQLKKKYKINYILGHKDIAPGRKDDPWNFSWNKIK